jgi:hypothetical protein
MLKPFGVMLDFLQSLLTVTLPYFYNLFVLAHKTMNGTKFVHMFIISHWTKIQLSQAHKRQNGLK